MTTEKQKQCVPLNEELKKEERMKSRIMSQSLFQCHAIYMVTDWFGYVFDNYSLWSIRYLDTCKYKELNREYKLYNKYIIHNKKI